MSLNLKTIKYRLIQDGLQVVLVEGPVNRAKTEIEHYFFVYSQDGSVKIQSKIKGGRWTDVAFKYLKGKFNVPELSD